MPSYPSAAYEAQLSQTLVTQRRKAAWDTTNQLCIQQHSKDDHLHLGAQYERLYEFESSYWVAGELQESRCAMVTAMKGLHHTGSNPIG